MDVVECMMLKMELKECQSLISGTALTDKTDLSLKSGNFLTISNNLLRWR